MLSLRRVHQIAIAAAIARIGFPVRAAAAIAKRFSDEPSEGRAPGELFQSGSTLIVQDAPGAARITNSPPKSPTALVVDVAPILADVTARLAARGIDVAA